MSIPRRLVASTVAVAATGLLAAAPAPAMVNGTLATAPGSTVSVEANTGPCSGTLITPSVVLTAAHCFPAGTTSVRVRTGTVDRSDGGGGQTFDAVRWTAHPDAAPPLHDLAYVDLGEDSTAATATTPGQGFLPPAGSVALIRGFGLVADGGEHQTLMREGQVQTIACPATIVAPVPTICTKSSPEYPATPCRGDSGGPMMDGAGQLFAVMSQSSAGCAEYATYTPLAGNLGFFDEAARTPRLTGRLVTSAPGSTVSGGSVRVLGSDGSVVAAATMDARGFQAVVPGGTYTVEASAPGYATRRIEGVVVQGPTALSPVMAPPKAAPVGKAKVTSVSRRRDGRLSVRLSVTPPRTGKVRVQVLAILQPVTKRGKPVTLGSVRVTVRKKGTITVTIAPKRSVRAKARVGRKVRVGVLTGDAVLANTTLKIRKG